MKKIPRYVGSATLAKLAVLAVLAASGCGAPSVKVQGRIMKDGKSYEAGPDDQILLIFIHPVQEGQKTSCVATVNKDGTFNVAGPEDHGIPLGTYVITLRVTPSIYASQGKPVQGEKFNDAFSKETSSPLTCEITAATKEVILDLDKKTATAQ